ncbi:MAG: two-component sensor histidine kinase [Planctomycetaceae bacterium]|nr:two-component sensor histidine kinase [Planctomycetaceae bacterium]
MGYRSIKKALGATNLERKCRILFGVCLALLIAAAFIWVAYNTERVVMKATRAEGQSALTNQLLRKHWDEWENDPDSKAFLKALLDAFTYHDYETEVLGLDTVEQRALTSRIPDHPHELDIVKRLQENIRLAKQGEMPLGEGDGSAEAMIGDLSNDTVFAEWAIPDRNEYHYYQPVHWHVECTSLCHAPASSAGIMSAIDSPNPTPVGPPFRVVKVVIPYEGTKDAINNARAGLITVGILTVFLAMIVLYVVVRYIVVKPLQHLRDVSEEISLGNTELRAEINTHDEFEELAQAFNRMLRHMREAQGELRDLNQSLDAKVDELAQLNMRLYDMNRLKSDFLANMSHELRTPLNSIIGFSEVLGSITSLNDKQRRYAQNIQKSGRLLLEMINDILDLAKLEAGKMEIRPSEFDLSVIVRAHCDMVRPLTEEKNIDLNFVADDLPLVYQDQSKIQQILTNLLSNAIKFTPEGGRISVAIAKTKHDRLELTVEDTGIGIPEEDREVIFEKFRQSTAVLDNDGLTREYSGTGLGLSIVREMCKLLGGEISFESQLGVGSTFKVQLPWNLSDRPKFSSDLSNKLDALARPDTDGLRPKDIARAAS